MKILVVSNLFPPDYEGGLELNAMKLATCLRDRGHNVHVVTSKFRAGFVPSEAEPDWVHRILTYIPHIPDSKKGKAARWEIMKKLADRVKVAEPNSAAFESHLSKNQYDLMYCFGLHQVSPGTLAPAAKRKIPTLWHVGDFFLADHFALHKVSRLYALMMNRVLKRWHALERAADFSHMAFVSQMLLDYYKSKQFPLQHAYVVPRGIEFEIREDDLTRQRSNPPRFVIACRLFETKGIHVGIEAAEALHRKNPEKPWKLTIVGSGEEGYEQRLKQMVSELGIENRVEFLGMKSRPETIEIVRDGVAFLNTSLWEEPFGNAIIEALATCTPLICALTGSILEIVEPGKSALAYAKTDAAELYSQMSRVLDEPDLRLELAKNGLEVVRSKYTIERILDMTERLLEEVRKDYGE